VVSIRVALHAIFLFRDFPNAFSKVTGKTHHFTWVYIQPIPEPLASQKTSQVRRVSCTITQVWVEREFNKRGINGMLIEIDPTVDFACKLLLGNPEYPDITIHFLNAILRLPAPIVSVEIVNPIVWKEFEADKLSILDILAIDNADRRLNVEVQRTKPTCLPQRLTYYSATQLVDQIGEGDSYRKLRPSIGICILNSVHFSQLAEYHSEFRLRTRSGLELTNCLEIHLLELPKYAPLEDNEPIADPRDQWMYFFRRANGSSVDELLDRLPDPVFERAVGVLEMISRTPDQRRHYDARLKWELDENTRIQTAFEEGEIKGREEGREEGEIKLIQTLQEILGGPVSDAAVFQGRSLEQLRAMTDELRKKIQRRT
jgi:predicted transposase/invertase (TIGR01784 family)